MNQRVKWIVVGLGLMYGIQLAIAWAIRLCFSSSVSNPESTFAVAVGYTIASFLAGGLIIGVLSDRLLIAEPIAAAAGALLLNWASASLNLSGEVLFFGDALRHAIAGVSSAGNLAYAAGVLALAIAAAVAGALIGDRIETPLEDSISRAGVVIGFAGLVACPYVMLIGHVPIAILSIAALAILAGIVWGVYRFEREPEREVSISPTRLMMLKNVQ